jgi:hypothetical protein
MTKQASIAYISGLMDNPASLTDGDQSSIAGYRQSFPYFVPARYLEALQKQKEKPDTAAMFAGAMPYMGNWVLFADFLAESSAAAVRTPVARVYTEDFVAGSESQSRKAADTVDKIVPKVIKEDELAEAPSMDVAGEVGEAVVELHEDVADLLVEDLPVAAQPDEIGVTSAGVSNFWIQDDAAGEDSADSVKPGAGSVVAEIMQGLDETDSVIDDLPKIEDFEDVAVEPLMDGQEEKSLISPVYTEDYYLQQGEKISTEFPEEIESLKPAENVDEAAKSLMVMMSFSEWLLHFKNTTEKQKEETKDQRALKTMWQKEKLAAAIEEENEEIPENVFEMAVNSITKEDGLASESLAKVYIKQGKYDRAIDMYRKLSLRNPQKSAYFALKIEEILKEKQS